MSIEDKVEALYKKWMNYKRGVLCNLDDRQKVVDAMIREENKVRILFSSLSREDKKKFADRLELVEAWRKSAIWMLRK